MGSKKLHAIPIQKNELEMISFYEFQLRTRYTDGK
jgi:hypothetical protein